MTEAVLQTLCVSVTYYVCLDGSQEWWLTRESGFAPSANARSAYQRPKGYVVFAVDGPAQHFFSCTLVGQLRSGSLGVLLRHIRPLSERMPAGWHAKGQPLLGPPLEWMSLVTEVTNVIMQGGFSCVESCQCSVRGVCDFCADSAHHERRFVQADSYAASRPASEAHWWQGYTDARGPQWFASCS